MTYKQVKEKEKKAKETNPSDLNGANGDMADDGGDASASKQRSISQMMQHSHSHTNGTNATYEPVSPARQRISLSMATSPIVDRTIQHRPNGHTHPPGDRDGDVEMNG